MAVERVRWALVGTSSFATEWIGPAIREGARSELAAVVSRAPERARQVAEQLGAPSHCAAISELDTSQVDGVFLVTPNSTHEPLAIEAAGLGLHVIVEKPMAPSVAACDRMAAAAARSAVTLAVGHCMTWAPPVDAACRLLADGAIGQVLSASISQSFVSTPDGQWRQSDATAAGGGPLFDVGSHVVDTLTRMLGPVRQVAAFLDHAVYDYPAHDLATLLLRFAGPVHAAAYTSFACEQNSFEIVGTEGTLVSREWIGRSFTGDLAIVRGDRTEAVPLEHRNVYLHQIRNVSEHILTGEPLAIGAESGAATVGVLEAAVHAAQTGTVVSV
jgi:predicted dehydrogenase